MIVLSILNIEPRIPEVENANHLQEDASLGKPFQLICRISAVPDPEILWYKDEELIQNGYRIYTSPDMKTLNITIFMPEDKGKYKCVGNNSFGSVEQKFNFNVNSDMRKEGSNWTLGTVLMNLGAGLIILVLLICTIYFSANFRRERRVKLFSCTSSDRKIN